MGYIMKFEFKLIYKSLLVGQIIRFFVSDVKRVQIHTSKPMKYKKLKYDVLDHYYHSQCKQAWLMQKCE